MRTAAGGLRIIVLALVMATLGGAPAQAANGSYTQHLCFNGDTSTGVGTPPELRLELGGLPLALVDSCAGALDPGKGLSVVTGLPTHTPDTARGGLSYYAPPNVTIASGEYFRAFRSPGNAAKFVITDNGEGWDRIYGLPRSETFYWYGTNGSDGSLVNRGTFATPLSAANGPVAMAIGNGTHWHIAWGCDTNGGGGCNVAPGSIEHRIYAGRVRLRDESAPRLTTPIGGTLSTANPVRGVQTITFGAIDDGAGVYRALLLVDGQVASAAVVDDNDGACRDVNPANDDPYEFGRAVPCKLSTGGTFSLDTTNVSDGARAVRVVVEDAAGNQAIVMDRVLTVANRSKGIGPGDDLALRGAPNGSPAPDQARLTLSWSKRRSQATRRVRFASRSRLYGRLRTVQGTAIAGAQMDVVATATQPGAKSRARIGVRTDKHGRFEIAWPRGGASKNIVVAYRSHVNDTIATAQASVRLRVAAGVSLRLSPRLVGAGRAVTFRGRVSGGPIPRGGKLVELQVRDRSGWRTLRVVRTNRRGVFRSRYRFVSTGSAARLHFRARSRFEAAFPYLTGVSPPRAARNLRRG